MSQTGLAWLVCYVVLAALTFRRSVYGFPLYLMTFYAPPQLWWWGQGVLMSIGDRWALAAGVIFAGGVFFDHRQRAVPLPPIARRMFTLLGVYVLNATMVHFLFALDPADSYEQLMRIYKFSVLAVLLALSIRSKEDLRLCFMALVMGGLYIGYEVYFNEAGRMRQGRLEGIPLGSASDSNFLSSVLSVSLLYAGFMVLFGPGKKLRVVGLVAAALLLEVIQQSLSRGTMLAVIAAVGVMLLGMRRAERKPMLIGLAGALLAAGLVMGPEDRQQMADRFHSIFVEEDERDVSSESRLQLWSRASKFLASHPQGVGGEAVFKHSSTWDYISDLNLPQGKAIHNGYLDTACSWGVQGLLLLLLTLWACYSQIGTYCRRAREFEDREAAFAGLCVKAHLVLMMGAAMFISSLKGEWFFWWLGLAVGLHQWVPVQGELADEEEEIEEYVDHIEPTYAPL
ncbi:O-Antigen ligase [Pseudobythopirellula maris]|uniref:O-Antigen ligase n=1 Tax=Pseudobythopirellula maris TaxID=2527991 RepID=A0A5C5ZQK2_9BACT|nr:O-antigen ligase family protein [Pseudobythopirellula maris]TWT89739.1 O-Antigen ligase [Pseudobythopirellula maris]